MVTAIKHIADLSIVLPLALAVVMLYKKVKLEFDLVLVLIFIGINTLATAVQFFMALVYGNNLVVGHVYTPVECTMLAMILAYQLNEKTETILIAGLMFQAACAAMDKIYWLPVETYGSLCEYVSLSVFAAYTVITMAKTNLSLEFNYKFNLVFTIFFYEFASLAAFMVVRLDTIQGMGYYSAIVFLTNLFLAVILGVYYWKQQQPLY